MPGRAGVDVQKRALAIKDRWPRPWNETIQKRWWALWFGTSFILKAVKTSLKWGKRPGGHPVLSQIGMCENWMRRCWALGQCWAVASTCQDWHIFDAKTGDASLDDSCRALSWMIPLLAPRVEGHIDRSPLYFMGKTMVPSKLSLENKKYRAMCSNWYWLMSNNYPESTMINRYKALQSIITLW